MNSQWVLPTCVAVSLLGGFIPVSNAFSIQRTFTFLPFFVLDYLTKEKGWIDNIRLKSWIGALVSVVIFCSMFIFSSLYEGATYFIKL